jgi:hypothetical protein
LQNLLGAGAEFIPVKSVPILIMMFFKLDDFTLDYLNLIYVWRD